MKLGFLTAPFPDTPLMEVADWAAANGFEVLEIACWPKATGPPGATPASHRRRPHHRRPGAGHPRRDRRQGPRDLRPRLLPEPAPPSIPTIGTRSSGTSST